MKRMGLVFAVAVLAASILSACVVVPYGGFHGGGFHHRHAPYDRPYYRGR